MSTVIPAAILETILRRLALLFLAGAQGNQTAARLAAARMLATHNAETEDELRLAANIISFSFPIGSGRPAVTARQSPPKPPPSQVPERKQPSN